MAKNSMDDLRDHLFLQLERLGDENLKGKDLQEEIRRAEAVAGVAREMTSNAKVEVQYLQVTGANRSGSNLFRRALPGGES